MVRSGSADEAESVILDRIAKKVIVIGFGHPVYSVCDPRNVVIKSVSRSLCKETNKQLLFDVSQRIEETMMKAKKMFPNLDWSIFSHQPRNTKHKPYICRALAGTRLPATTAWGFQRVCLRLYSSSAGSLGGLLIFSSNAKPGKLSAPQHAMRDKGTENSLLEVIEELLCVGK